MFATIDADLADRHESIQLGRGDRTARGRDLPGPARQRRRHLLRQVPRSPSCTATSSSQALDRLTAPRRLSRDRHGDLVVDESAPGHNNGANSTRPAGAAWCELIEHLPTAGGRTAATAARCWSPSTSTPCSPASVPPASTPASAITAGEARRLACNAGLVPAVLDGDSMPAGPRPHPTPPHPHPTPRPGPDPRHLRRRRLPTPLRLVRDPPPPTPWSHGGPHRPRQRPPPVRPPPPPSPRHPLRPPPTTRRRMGLPPTHVRVARFGACSSSFSSSTSWPRSSPSGRSSGRPRRPRGHCAPPMPQRRPRRPG